MSRRRHRLFAGRFTPAILAPTLWLEMAGNGILKGSTSGTYTGPLGDQTAVLAAGLSGAEVCEEWRSIRPATVNVDDVGGGNRPAWLTRAENIFAVTPALDFTAASDQRLTNATPIDLSVGCSVAIVFETDTVATTQVLINSTSGTADRFAMGLNTDQLRAGWFDTTFRGAVSSNNPTSLLANTKYVAQYYRNGATGLMWINGVSQGGGNSPSNLTAVTARLSIGHRSDLSGSAFDGRILAVLIKGGANGWGTAFRSALDTYLSKKFNVPF